MQSDKLHFITKDFFLLLNDLTDTTKARWGKMSPQQMVEHVTSFFNVSTERIKFPLITPEEHLPKYREFLYSDKDFRENTKAPAAVLGEEPMPLQYLSLPAAIEKLHESVETFTNYFEAEPGKKTCHPVFGMLDFKEWVLLHYKHVTHHCRQFGLL